MSSKWLVESEPPRQASGDVPSASAVYRHAAAKDGLPQNESPTLFESFNRAVAKYPNNKCLGSRPKKADGTVGDYAWKTYKEVADEVTQLASGLKGIGAAAKGSIGVFGPNCAEWMVALQARRTYHCSSLLRSDNLHGRMVVRVAQACNRVNAQCVPLYDSLGENAIEFIIAHSESSITFVSTDKFPALAKALVHEKTKAALKTIVYWGDGHPASIEVRD